MLIQTQSHDEAAASASWDELREVYPLIYQQPIDDYAEDSGEELFTTMYCFLTANSQWSYRNSIKECNASW